MIIRVIKYNNRNMISKTTYTKSAANTLRYVLREGKNAELLLTRCFPWSLDADRHVDFCEGLLSQNPTLKNQAFHFALAFSPNDRDKIEEIGMDVIASAWLSELERLSGNKFMFGLCVRHNDTNHPHCHFVILNLDTDMRSLNSFQLSKLARICAQTVTEKYGLTVAKGPSKVHLEHQLQQENNDISKDFDGITVNSYSSNSSSRVHFGIGGVGVIGSDGGYDDDEDDDDDDTTGKKRKKKRRRRKL